MLRLSAIVTVSLILTACHPKISGDIISQSPGKSITVTISAVRPMVADPWNVTLKVKAYALKESKITFEVYGELTEQNVRFDWEDNNHYTITVPDRNEKPRTFGLVADTNEVRLNEI